MSRARSAHEIIGLPALSGLPPLAPEDAQAVPYAALRQKLARQFRDAGKEAMQPGSGFYSKAAWEEYVNALAQEVPEEQKKAFEAERVKAEKALAETDPQKHAWIEADLDTAERQLLWDATQLHLFSENQLGEDYGKAPLIRQMLSSRYMDSILMNFGANMADQGINTQLTIGPPGSWFYNVHDAHIVNLDLFYLLLAGGSYSSELRRGVGHFEFSAMHEFSHEQSRQYPDAMQQLWRQAEALKKKEESEGLDDEEEVKQYQRLVEEFNLRHGLWNAAEDNFANRNAVNHARQNPDDPGYDPTLDKGGTYPIDLADSRNVTATLIKETGECIVSPPPALLPANAPPLAKAHERLNNLRHATNMVFHVDNHLVPDTDEGWRALHVHPELIENFKHPQFSPAQALDRLKELARGIQTACPLPGDISFRQFETDSGEIIKGYDAWIDYHNAQRNILIGHIFEEYADPLIKEILQEQEKEAEKQKQQGQGKEKGQGRNQAGQGQPGQGQPGQQGQGGQQGGQSGEGGETISFRVKGKGKKVDVPELPSQTPGEARGKEIGKKQGGKAPGEIAQANEGAPTTGQLRDRKLNGGQPKGNRGNAPGKDGKEAEGKTPGDNAANAPLGQIPGGGAGVQNSPFDGLQLGDGRSYAELVKDPRFHDAVEAIAAWDKRLQEKAPHFEDVPDESQLDYAPDDGDFQGRLNSDAVDNFTRAVAQRRLSTDHLRFFNSEQPVAFPTDLLRFLIVDGSGSMTSDKERIEIAMKLAAALNAGTKRNDQPCYIDMWGDDEPWPVVTPGMSEEDEILAIDGILIGKNCGTRLAPAIRAIAQRLAEAPLDHNKHYGLIHIPILSDGDIFDAAEAKIAIEELLNSVPNAVIDALIVRLPDGELKKLLESIDTIRPYQKPGVYVSHSWQQAHCQLAEMLEARALQAGRINTITPDVLQRQLRAAGEMER